MTSLLARAQAFQDDVIDDVMSRLYSMTLVTLIISVLRGMGLQLDVLDRNIRQFLALASCGLFFFIVSIIAPVLLPVIGFLLAFVILPCSIPIGGILLMVGSCYLVYLGCKAATSNMYRLLHGPVSSQIHYTIETTPVCGYAIRMSREIYRRGLFETLASISWKILNAITESQSIQRLPLSNT